MTRQAALHLLINGSNKRRSRITAAHPATGAAARSPLLQIKGIPAGLAYPFRMQIDARHMLAIFALFICLMLAWSQALSGERDRVIAEGANDYKAYCSACHGPKGQGKGEMAPILVKPPTDLTQLADSTGRFPFWRMYDIIAGDDPVAGHETFQMPQFSTRLTKDDHKPGYHPAYIRILLLTHFVESLQRQ